MKKFLLLSAILTVGIWAMFAYMNAQNWTLESSKLSPNEEYGIYQFLYASDGDHHAPYGTYLFLQSTKAIQNPLEGYLIFAGYCGNNLSYDWLANESVVITCAASDSKSIRTSASKAYGIRIKLTLTNSS